MKLAIFFLLLSSAYLSQNIKKHQWKNRALLVFSKDENAKNIKYQELILKEHQKELNERKIVLYLFTKNKYIFNFEEFWTKGNLLYKKYVHKTDNFKIVLIGLDGSIKLEQDAILASKKLFKIIDAMPMRKRELKNKNLHN